MASDRETTTARKAALAIQREKAIALRLAGLGYAATGQKLGISTAAAFRAVDYVLKQSAKHRAEAAETILDGELERLDRLQVAAWARAIAGDVDAIRACLSVLTHRAKLLGLEAPTKVEVRAEDVRRAFHGVTEATVRVLLERLPKDQADPIIEALRDEWSRVDL